MNADEIQYSLDRRNEVDLPLSDPDTDNVITRPIQVGHLTGDVIIRSSFWARLNYLGPPGRAVFEYNYTGEQEPPRFFFEHVYCRNPGVGTYNVNDVAFFRVIQPNTSPKAIFANHCSLSNNGSYLFDGPDASSCDGIQIKNCEGGGSGFLRWKLRSAAKMVFLEINNTRYLANGRVGPSTDLKNTNGVYFITYTDEGNTDLHQDLVGVFEGPLSHRFVNPRGYNRFEHNWNEYSTVWDVESPNCWATSIRVDDTSGNYGMHFLRRYQTPFRHNTSTDTPGVQMFGGHSDSNSGSLYVERLDALYTPSYEPTEGDYFGGKVFPKITDGMDVPTSVNTQYTDLNATGITNRLEVYDADGQPRGYGNSRDPFYNTQYRLDRIQSFKDFDDVLNEQSQVAYGGANSLMTFDGSDIVIEFKGSDTLHVTEEIQVEVAIAGGGGSGGCQDDTSLDGGGGGAGGFYTNYGGTKITLSPGDYPVVVGLGGVFEWGTFGTGVDGGPSSFNGITVPGGGGGGGSEDLITFTDGNDGGCGGGAAAYSNSVGGSGSAYGYAGGSSDETSGGSGGSGGGGAGSAGGNGYADGVRFGGDGGAGVACAITGTSVTYCEGGGGGSNNNNQGDGGVEGGGWPGTSSITYRERDGKKNLGGGGGGGATDEGSITMYPGNGGDGVVIIRISGS